MKVNYRHSMTVSSFHLNFNFENYEFYYKFGGTAENTNDWYSLLAAKYDTNGDILLHCMFDAAVEVLNILLKSE